MVIVKLIVLICCANSFNASRNDYCKICLNHTLCKYKTQGPSPSCKGYDSSALLTSQDITELVNKINERRNFVAMGYSKSLPQAADMKKIHWSTELATFAQRWADQCDPSIRPDKEDQCRDFVNLKVGQSIASVFGPSPGLSIKGFVEMWFIQILDYTGSVTYYNISQDFKTRYFSQLTWANTEFVGCGKAKFYVDERNFIFERLVCNFAPSGNIHGKPLYSMGYPGTQCNDEMTPDDQYKGLCVTKLTTQRRPPNSLLRILNLSNDSVKHEIDPIHSNLKLTIVNSNSSNEQRNQKTRHISSNKTNAAAKRIPQLQKQIIGKNVMNISGHDSEYHYQHDRGHSHLYHGYEPPRYNYEMTTALNANQDFRRYDYTTEPINSYSTYNYRKHYQTPQCTRRITPIQNNCESNPCPREPDSCCQQTTIRTSTCTEISCTQPMEAKIPSDPCIPPLPQPCTCTKQTCPPTSTSCNFSVKLPCSTSCSTNSQCQTTMCPEKLSQTTMCPEILRHYNDYNDYRKSGTFQYYDMIPNVVVRSGNHKIPPEKSSQKSFSIFYNSDNGKSYKTIFERKDHDPSRKLHESDYLYHSYDSNSRNRRQLEDQITFKPFWQIKDFKYKKPTQLKSMRFTTLSNKKNRKINRNKETSTEPITLKLADYAEYQPKHVTEKYLSFDELMHLRKINDGYAQYDLRRENTPKRSGNKSQQATLKDKKTSAITTSRATTATTKMSPTTKLKVALREESETPTTEYTIIPPFVPKKECTRKLTCTWTAFTAAGENGNGNGVGPIGPEIGSRTPPGYVDGCTRTHTCTRIYMDRNKIITIPDENENGSSEPTPEDEDYCERRSLNVQRRNSDDRKPTLFLLRHLDRTHFAKTTTDDIRDLIIKTSKDSVAESVPKTHHCICNDRYARKKRQGSDYPRDNVNQFDDNSFSYADLYYLILNKILKSNQVNQCNRNQCSCNGSIKSTPKMYLFLFIFLIYLI